MDFDVEHSLDSIKEGTKEVAETAQEKTSRLHENYVSKILPDCGKYGDAAEFAAGMVPGVDEYNAIRKGDWADFAVSAGIDVGSVALGSISFGTGYVATKTGAGAAKIAARKAAKEVAEAGAEKTVKEIAETGTKKAVREVAEDGAEKAVKEAAEVETEKAVKRAGESGIEKATRETAETGIDKAAKEAIGEGTEKTAKETAEAGAERTALKAGDKIDKTRFPEYLDDIEKKTHREIPAKQKEIIKKDLDEKDYFKLDPKATYAARQEFSRSKEKLILEWEKKTGQAWPRYTEDILDKAGKHVIREKGKRYDVHHVVELSIGGKNEWSNIYPCSYEEHKLIHAKGTVASDIFRYR